MKKILGMILVFIVFVILFSSSSFATVPGNYYINAKEPTAASEIPGYNKKVEGSCTSILSLFAFGDASVATLAKQSGITEIQHIDKNTFSIWFLYNQVTYTIYGK